MEARAVPTTGFPDNRLGLRCPPVGRMAVTPFDQVPNYMRAGRPVLSQSAVSRDNLLTCSPDAMFSPVFLDFRRSPGRKLRLAYCG